MKRKPLIGVLLTVGLVFGLALPAVAHTDAETHTDFDWTAAMNQETYWETYIADNYDQINVSCTKYENGHNGDLPAQYEFGVVKAGLLVALYDARSLGSFNMENPQNPNDNPSWVMKCNSEDAPPPPVDLCDPADKPGGMDIAEWLASEGFEASDCFEFEVGQECGLLDVSLTRNDTPFNFLFLWNYGDAPDLDNAQTFPATFAEDENGGTVEVTYYVAGPESDYFVGYGIPNFWDGGETVTVDTDCEETPPTTTPTTLPPTTTTTTPSTTTTEPPEETTTTTTVPVVEPSGSVTLACEADSLVARVSVDEESEAGYHLFVFVNGEATDHREFIANDGQVAIADAAEGSFVKVELYGGDDRLDFAEMTVDCEADPTTTTSEPVEELPFTGMDLGVAAGLGASALGLGVLTLLWGLSRKEETA